MPAVGTTLYNNYTGSCCPPPPPPPPLPPPLPPLLKLLCEGSSWGPA